MVGLLLCVLVLMDLVVWVMARPNRNAYVYAQQEAQLSIVARTMDILIDNYIEQYLRATVDRNIEVLKSLGPVPTGDSALENDALSQARNILGSQRIGDTGYVCALGLGENQPSLATEIKPDDGPLVSKLEHLKRAHFDPDGEKEQAVFMSYAERGPSDAALSARQVVAYMRPLRKWQRVVAAVCFRDEMIVDLRMDKLADQKWFSGNAFGRPMLIDRQGRNWTPGWSGEIKTRQEGLLDTIIQQDAGQDAYDIFDPQSQEFRPALISWQSVPHSPWVLMSVAWKTEALAASPGPSRVMLPAMLLVSLVVASGIGWFLARSSRNVHVLQSQAEKMIEVAVHERTRALSEKAEILDRDLQRSRLAEKDLLRRNQDLREQKEEAEAISQRIQTLTHMVDLLQTSKSVQETGDVIVQQAEKLFPDDSGVLYLFNEENVLETITGWGDPLVVDGDFLNEDCWALRRGDTYEVEDADEKLICSHVSSAPPHGYICMPIKARNEFFGMLHVQWGPPPEDLTPEAETELVGFKKELASTVSHQFSLALANLKLRDLLQAQSIRDQLTGLFNRRHMEASLIRELHRAKRHEKPLGIIMLDVDHFKKFNDTHGHEEGDDLLRRMGELLRGNVRQEDIVCRYGGEEFLIILPDAGLEVAAQRARLLRERVRSQLLVQGEAVTISVGVSVFPEHGATAESLVSGADTALYAAKEAGRDRVEIFSS